MIIPYLCVDRAADAIEFYQRAFGFEEEHRMAMPGGKIGHAALVMGNAKVFLSDESPMSGVKSPKQLGGTTVNIHLESADVDAAFERAVAAGAKAIFPPTDMFWGDRFCKVADPFGHMWSIATHKEDLTPAEMMRRGEEAMRQYVKA